jgi:formamidopyrimidine-DNA glycosylase
MKSKCLSLLRVASVFSLVLCIGSSGFARRDSQDPPKQEPDKPKVSEGEANAVTAINSAPDAAAKLAAAGEFVKKYPKSTLRPQVAKHVGAEISKVADASQKLKLAEDFQAVFKQEEDSESIGVIKLDALLTLKRIDDAFSQGAALLAKQPENVAIMSHLAMAGTEEAKRQNAKYVQVSTQYGLKSIELIEANKKPVYIDDANWDRQKTMLPILYLNMGILSLVSSNPTEAKVRFEKASALNPAEPTTYALLGNIYDEEYQKLALSHKGMPAGKEKDETLKKATELMDKTIDLYARALGVSAGKAEHKQLQDHLMQSITPYYKYRHNGSTDGLQQLIDKYKAPATP